MMFSLMASLAANAQSIQEQLSSSALFFACDFGHIDSR